MRRREFIALLVGRWSRRSLRVRSNLECRRYISVEQPTKFDLVLNLATAKAA